MKIKQLIIGTFLLLATLCSNAQTPVDINYKDSSTLTVNGLPFNSSTNFQDVIKKLGAPDKIVDYPRNEKSYFYETQGFVIMTQDAILKGIGINYNWDGDKKFPTTTFSGHLTIGGTSLSKEANKENLSSIRSIGFACPMSIMCASTSRSAKVRCTAAFNDSNLITQIVFLLL